MRKTTLLDAVRQLLPSRLGFTLAYLQGKTPWDTAISPPELVEVTEGAAALPPGRALDLGCGTGTNVLYLARHGWQATGIDFAGPAIAHAHEKLRAAGPLKGSAHFVQGDVTRLGSLPLAGPFTLFLDLGCFHNLDAAGRDRYVAGITESAAGGATYLLYAFAPRRRGRRMVGVTPEEVRERFAGGWSIEHIAQGTDSGRGWSAAWYRLRRRG